VPIHWVNAKAALRGRVESKEPLVEFSGILELEQALDKARMQIDSERDRLQNVLRHHLDNR
jgi:hypothetical protein